MQDGVCPANLAGIGLQSLFCHLMEKVKNPYEVRLACTITTDKNVEQAEIQLLISNRLVTLDVDLMQFSHRVLLVVVREPTATSTVCS